MKTLKTNNAKLEIVPKKFSFWSNAKNKRRCVILAQGYYEWKYSIPYYISNKNGKLLYMAGFYDTSNPIHGLVSCLIN